jgi:hypothetical protein
MPADKTAPAWWHSFLFVHVRVVLVLVDLVVLVFLVFLVAATQDPAGAF